MAVKSGYHDLMDIRWFRRIKKMLVPLSIAEILTEVLPAYVLSSGTCSKKARVIACNSKEYQVVPAWDYSIVLFKSRHKSECENFADIHGLTLVRQGDSEI